MRIKINSDESIVKKARENLKANDGYCPCKIEKTPDTKCMCKEFIEAGVGPCQCELYIKVEE